MYRRRLPKGDREGRGAESKADQRVLISKKKHCKKGTTCDYWHTPECMKLETPTVCKHGDRCISNYTSNTSDVKRSKLGTIGITTPDTREANLVSRDDQTSAGAVRSNFGKQNSKIIEQKTNPNSHGSVCGEIHQFTRNQDNKGLSSAITQNGKVE